MNARDMLISLALILMICGLLGALGCVLADWRRYMRWFRHSVRWRRVTSAWARWQS